MGEHRCTDPCNLEKDESDSERAQVVSQTQFPEYPIRGLTTEYTDIRSSAGLCPFEFLLLLMSSRLISFESYYHMLA
jgi:hypothetical protein